MTILETRLDEQFSQANAAPASWEEARAILQRAPVSWLSTVRPDGRPHVTPLISVWMDEAVYFCTGPQERKARNLEDNTSCALTTGSDALDRGLDVVVEGEAVAVRDEDVLRRVAAAYVDKYGAEWTFQVRDGAFAHPDAGRALVFRIRPVTAFGFRKGDFGQTRWRFERR
jgi:nitroimidazol reductase NimA-like FMN-containing flavoprotein (pyridoxamine 5'-phosphate oxidase superfamily)